MEWINQDLSSQSDNRQTIWDFALRFICPLVVRTHTAPNSFRFCDDSETRKKHTEIGITALDPEWNPPETSKILFAVRGTHGKNACRMPERDQQNCWLRKEEQEHVDFLGFVYRNLWSVCVAYVVSKVGGRSPLRKGFWQRWKGILLGCDAIHSKPLTPTNSRIIT